jgi:hypothetical protein
VRWVIWGLAFKLTLLSGITKILSGDPTWAQWTALGFHYETQPIPAWTSWFAHQLPSSIHYWSVAAMFVVELGVPWLIFMPARFRRVRLVACLLMIGLQAGIAATGNYGFFNVLTIALYLALLDDHTLKRFLPRAIQRAEQPIERSCSSTWRSAMSAIAVGVATLSALTFFREIDVTRGRRGLIGGEWADRTLDVIAPFNSVSGYGLFRVMTTERPEIVIEVSEDGRSWKEYEFRWKAGDVMRRPRFVEPHMPRLDWQMWFAALDPVGNRDWLTTLARRLEAGTPEVLGLLGRNPFAEAPPRAVRMVLYQYRFSTPAERDRTGSWWTRTPVAEMGL